MIISFELPLCFEKLYFIVYNPLKSGHSRRLRSAFRINFNKIYDSWGTCFKCRLPQLHEERMLQTFFHPRPQVGIETDHLFQQIKRQITSIRESFGKCLRLFAITVNVLKFFDVVNRRLVCDKA